MFLKIGTLNDLDLLNGKLPEGVFRHLHSNIQILDENYGANRNIDRDDGGYCLFGETEYDIHLMYAAVDLDRHPCEWVDLLDGGYCSAMFLISNEFAIVCVMPVSIAPATIRAEILFAPDCSEAPPTPSC